MDQQYYIVKKNNHDNNYFKKIILTICEKFILFPFRYTMLEMYHFDKFKFSSIDQLKIGL